MDTSGLIVVNQWLIVALNGLSVDYSWDLMGYMIIYHGELLFLTDDSKHHGQYFRKRNELYLSKKNWGYCLIFKKKGIGQYFWSELGQ